MGEQTATINEIKEELKGLKNKQNRSGIVDQSHILAQNLSIHPSGQCREEICDRSTRYPFAYITFNRIHLPLLKEVVSQINPQVFKNRTLVVPYYKSNWKPPQEVGLLLERTLFDDYFPQTHIMLGLLRILPTNRTVSRLKKWLLNSNNADRKDFLHRIINTSLEHINSFETFKLILCPYAFPLITPHQYQENDSNYANGKYNDTIYNWQKSQHKHPPTSGQAMFWLKFLATEEQNNKVKAAIKARMIQLKKASICSRKGVRTNG